MLMLIYFTKRCLESYVATLNLWLEPVLYAVVLCDHLRISETITGGSPGRSRISELRHGGNQEETIQIQKNEAALLCKGRMNMGLNWYNITERQC